MGTALMEMHKGKVMTDKVGTFCDNVHEKLDALEGRIDSLKSNIGTTWHFLQEKLVELRHNDEARKRSVTKAQATLLQWLEENKTESKSTIDQRIENREDSNACDAGPKGGGLCRDRHRHRPCEHGRCRTYDPGGNRRPAGRRGGDNPLTRRSPFT